MKKVIDNDVSDIDITPLSDVVFIMLIFFIVTASFVKESGLDVNTPSQAPSELPSDTSPIVLLIDAQNQLSIDGRQLDVRAVRPTIVRLKAERPDAVVVIKTSPEAKTKMIVSALDSVRAAKVMQPMVSLAGD